MYYFQQFPQTLYTFDRVNNRYQLIVNITARVAFLSSVLSNTLIYYPYAVQDGDTPWSIADKLYDDPLRHWIVLMSNMMMNPYFDWPLTLNDFNNNINLAFGSIATAEATLDHVEQQTLTTTLFNGTSNTSWSNVTLNSAFTYDFTTGQLQTITLPTIENPIIPGATIIYEGPDGSIITQNTQYVAISAYNQAYNTNEAKRVIQLLDPSYVGTVEAELQSLLSS